MQLDARGVEILHVFKLAAPVLAQIHDRADIFGRGDEIRLCIRLLRLGNFGGVRVVERGVDIELRAVGLRDLIDDVRSRRDEVEVIFALEPFEDDLHVQKPQKAAAEAEAQRNGVFLREAHGGVVQLQLFQRVAQIAVFRAVRRVYAREDHRLRLMIARKGFGCRVFHACDGVAHAGVGDGLDGGREISDLARAEAFRRDHTLRVQIPDFHDLVNSAGGHHADIHAGIHRAVHDAQIDDRAAVGVILAVEDQTLQRRFPVARGRGNVVHDHFQHGMNVDAVLGGNFGRVHGRNADDVLDLLLDLGGTRCRQIDLVDDGQDLQPVVDGQIRVRQRLGLNALRGVDDQHRALAGG